MKTLNFTESTAFLRTDFVPMSQANLNISSSAVLYGLSIYTVFSVNWDAKNKHLLVFRLEDHYQRLLNSAKIMDFHNFVEQWPFEKFKATMLDLLMRNKIDQDVLVRVTVFIDEQLAGTKIHGLKNSLSAFVYPLGQLHPKNGISACISSWERNADNAIPARAKVNGSYINASLMKNEALLNGYDDAIAVDHFGHVSESTVANVFLVRGGKLITPDTATDILEGITRDSILQLAKHLHIPVEQRTVDRSELYIADEVFLCGSSAGIVPITSIDKRPIGTGQPGNVSKQLSKEFDAILHGKATDFGHWLYSV